MNFTELGWWYSKGKWYYYNYKNERLTGWRKIEGYWHFFHEDGTLAEDEIISGYKINSEGRLDDEVLCSNKRKRSRE